METTEPAVRRPCWWRDLANKQIARLTDLIKNLVKVTRIEGDSSAHNLEPVSLCELLREVVEDAEIEAGPG